MKMKTIKCMVTALLLGSFLSMGQVQQVNAQVSTTKNQQTEDPEYWKHKKIQQETTKTTKTNEFSLPLLGSSGNAASYQHSSKLKNRDIVDMIDVSRWQGTINWKKVKKDGISYAIIRVGYRGSEQGTLNKDIKFDTNIKQATAAGIKVGIYFYSQAITENEAVAEAKYAIKAAGKYKLALPVVIDYEYAESASGLTGRLYKAHLSKKKATAVCRAFCKEVKRQGKVPMIYANRSVLSTDIDGAALAKDYKIWLAEYNHKALYSGTYDFWQYSPKCKVDGIDGAVDGNFWYRPKTTSSTPSTTIDEPADTPSTTDPVTADGKHLANASVTLRKTSYRYTETAHTPAADVYYGDKKLKKNVDYMIDYRDNFDPGKATAIITGIGSYTGTVKRYFTIK